MVNKSSHSERLASMSELDAYNGAIRRLSLLLLLMSHVQHDSVAVQGRFLAHHQGGCLAIREVYFERHLQIGGLSFTE
jgi:hypothetical protein